MKAQPIIDSLSEQFTKLLNENWAEIEKLQKGAKKIRFAIQGIVQPGAVAKVQLILGFGVKEKFASSEEIDEDQMALGFDGAGEKPKRTRRKTPVAA